MNKIARNTDFSLSGRPPLRPTTQAAEGVPRLRWTLAEFERLCELGIIGENEHIELVGGELVPMAAKGNRHEFVRGEINDWLIRRLPKDARLFPEPGWRPGSDDYLEPDFLVTIGAAFAPSISPAQVLLVIEIARSSLAYDTGTKMTAYALLGVREYWVVNAVTLETRVHKAPDAGRYAEVRDVAPSETIVPHLVPALALAMADLGIE